ncbi:MAG: hypothetical protein CMC51_05845 [Flavobacteriaceae bacterium]|nr:hypothetical protein [Flavobacteriaceae bacterium]|tara:strand:+ start:19812 stop:20471 length:660 start_codon:yes stop_codon:yes gene_type:complete
MKNLTILITALISIYSCDNEKVFNPLNYNPELSVSENLTNGVSVLDILEYNDVSLFNGLEFAGGFIFHVNETTGEMIVATDFSNIGDVAWGDVFELDTSHSIGEGDINTLQIIEGNNNDNSSNGTEFGSDNYAFKIVDDLSYNGYNDWYIPSSGSMELIYNNIHSIGMGNFNETLFYWSSTKEGYFPYVMAFNFESWGGLPFPGSCLDVNGILIARKVL